MTQQVMYQAIVCVLRATKAISKRLGPARATLIQKRITTLELASRRAFEACDGEKLRALCDDVSQLGDEVKERLRG
jgi:DNA-directed RNA polymerase subunit F